MAKTDKYIRVDFKDHKSGILLGYTELPWEKIPRQFRSKSGLELKGESYTILSADPGKQKDWIREKKLTLTLVKAGVTVQPDVKRKEPEAKLKEEVSIATAISAEEAQPSPEIPQPEKEPVTPAEVIPAAEEETKPTADPLKKVLEPVVQKPDVTSIPWQEKPAAGPVTYYTKCGNLPKLTGETADPERAMFMLSLDWRQIELIATDQKDFVDGEMEALRAGSGMYERKAITQPVGSRFTVDEFISAVMPDAEKMQGVCFQGEKETAEGSFALRSPNGEEAYGAAVAGFVFVLGFRRFPLPAETQRKLSAFMADNRLVLVHWIRGRVLQPSDLA